MTRWFELLLDYIIIYTIIHCDILTFGAWNKTDFGFPLKSVPLILRQLILGRASAAAQFAQCKAELRVDTEVVARDRRCKSGVTTCLYRDRRYISRIYHQNVQKLCYSARHPTHGTQITGETNAANQNFIHVPTARRSCVIMSFIIFCRIPTWKSLLLWCLESAHIAMSSAFAT